MDNEDMTKTQQEELTKPSKPQEPTTIQEKDRNKLTIEIHRFQNLLEILKDRKKVFRLSFIMILIGLIVFWGITKIVVSIKRLYPYNDITTNVMGTTTLRSESKDVSYFLLNSSELWANSGIQVKKGQTITIKSSGKKHTAIHHLFESTQKNQPGLIEPWVGAEGISEDFGREERDRQRARYRIFPNTNQDILLMQIVPNGKPSERPNALVYDETTETYELKHNMNQFFVVGNKMDNIHINTDGVLYFAINDIVLDDEIITKMMLECCGEENINHEALINKMLALHGFREKYKQQYYFLKKKYDSSKPLNEIFDSAKVNQNTIVCDYKKKSDELYNGFLDSLGVKKRIDAHKIGDKYGKFEFGNGYGIDSNKIELYGYFMNQYKEAWYDDNVGSFLILVEKVND